MPKLTDVKKFLLSVPVRSSSVKQQNLTMLVPKLAVL